MEVEIDWPEVEAECPDCGSTFEKSDGEEIYRDGDDGYDPHPVLVCPGCA